MNRLNSKNICRQDTKHSEVFDKQGAVRLDAAVTSHQLLSQLLVLSSSDELDRLLDDFFFNVYEYIMPPYKLLLLLITVYLSPLDSFQDSLLESHKSSSSSLIDPTRTLYGEELPLSLKEYTRVVKSNCLQIISRWIYCRHADFILDKTGLSELLVSFVK